MKITAYTSSNCFYCEQLKQLFIKAELEWESILIDTEEKRKEFKKTYPNAVGYPHVIIDGVEHGGLVNVAKYLVKNGHVSTKKG